MRTRKKPWSNRELTENQCIVNTPKEWRGKWSEYFKNENPIHLEIGCGKGKFITAAAVAFPDINFIGLEREPVILAAAARLNRVSGGDEVAYIINDVEELPELFAEGEIETLYIQFCDPWPNRKKWAKRRLTHSRFLEIYRGLEIKKIFFKTDNRQLFEFSVEQFSENGWTIRNVSCDLHAEPQDQRFITEYEAKFMAQSLPIYKLEAYRMSGGCGIERLQEQIEKPDKTNNIFAQKEQDYESGDIKID